MVMMRALTVVATALAVVTAVAMEAAAAATYTVGAPEGLWDLQTDYAQWVKTKTFHPGDKITFTYSPELHDVVEVTESGYGACSSANNISAVRTGNDVVPLTAVGTRYFLCSLTGHCANGMKIRVDVIEGGAAAPGPAASASSTTATAASPSAAGLGSGLLVAVVAAALWKSARPRQTRRTLALGF